MDDLILIKEVEGELITTSRNVAHVFGKEHKSVLRSIDQMKMSNDFRQRNFALTDFIDKNRDRQRKYEMTRDGWSILVMGFQGEKAMKHKELYIAKFNEMEKHLKKLADPSQMTKLDWIEIARQQEIEKLALQESKKLLENKIQEDRPLVEFAKNIESSPEAIEVGDFAKILCKKGFEIGRNRLFKQMKDKGGLKMLINAQRPYQHALDSGWLEVEEFPYKDSKKEDRIAKKVMITGKGQLYIEKKLRGLALDKEARKEFFKNHPPE